MLRGLQETRVATREESGVLGFGWTLVWVAICLGGLHFPWVWDLEATQRPSGGLVA